MPFFSQDFSDSLKAAAGTGVADRERYVNPSIIGKADGVVNPYRFSILSDAPLEGYELWIELPEGKRTKRVIEGNSMPTADVIEATAKAAGGTPAEAKEYGTEKPLGRPDIRRVVNFFVFEYERAQISLITISQKGLMQDLMGLLGDPDYEDLSKWDVEIQKVVSDRTSYSVNMKPARRTNADVEEQLQLAWKEANDAGFNLEALLIGASPFKAVA